MEHSLLHMLRNVSILDVAKALSIRVRGKQAMCFAGHDRKTASLKFNPDKNVWHCFGCGRGGGIVKLVMEVLGISRSGAVQWLGENFSYQFNSSDRGLLGRGPTTYPSGATLPSINAFKNIKDGSYMPDPEIYEYFLSLCPLLQNGHQYLVGRGFREDTIKRFRIGELTDVKRMRAECLKKWNVSRLLSCGLFKIRQNRYGTGFAGLVWWDDVLLFPFVQDGHIVYIQGRRLDEKRGAKYVGLNGLAKPLFNQEVLKTLNSGDVVYICEGVPDTMSAAEMGFHAVGVLGAHSFKEEYVDVLLPYRIVVIPDRDMAGEAFARKIQEAFRRKGSIVEVADLPYGKDLTEYWSTRK
jgi:DNA primase